MATICLHNLKRMRYPGLQNNNLDQEDDSSNQIPGAWRTEEVLQEDRRSISWEVATWTTGTAKKFVFI
ncbi:hypothetical protein HOLleu_36292 [Holothuria leucospilota]|uniref:Uncharacterized protein n=1 Tax=Holothuria leucospilota TaxID=206669 RepID=A0A9Q0YJJ4_HOLLE|nr:hypothetical protein HOLleu_36292 [Holothuria leucospilota]